VRQAQHIALGYNRDMEKIAQARKAAGATQAALAQHLGVTVAAVAHWENGRREPSVKTLRAIAEALGVKVAALIE